MRVAVVGHHEWIEALRVDHLPVAGEIVHAIPEWEAPAGGGPAAAGQLLRLAGSVDYFTALGDDDLGHRAVRVMEEMGFSVHAVFRNEPTRRGIVHIDDTGERTITVIGARLAPFGDDDLPWDLLEEADAVYFTAGDTAALRQARRARVLVATARAMEVLATARVQLDALVGSAADPAETYRRGDIDPVPHLVVRTEGGRGGVLQLAGEAERRFAPAPIPGAIVDRYGAGDSFAGALTYGLGTNMGVDRAIELAARAGASVLTGRGPYETQLTSATS